jgi:hypothetical protein
MAWSGDGPTVYNVPLGTVDGDPGIAPAEHWHVASKAPWHQITDDLPQYETFPPDTH